ncbi:MAG: hypothetical protein M3515_06055 [Actinomycetota bacterium]|nr:hypothetical protein [Actinomycetota bacterium]MDQ3355830.1 hypothetical protein [Actinomycetota bacterium]
MARTRRRRETAAPPERLWDVVADPHHLPRRGGAGRGRQPRGVEARLPLRLEPGREGGATRVQLSLSQRLRGWARVGGFLFRGASKRRLDEALVNLDNVMAG